MACSHLAAITTLFFARTSAWLRPIAGPATGGTVVTIAVNSSCYATPRCHFGSGNATSNASQYVDTGNNSSLATGHAFWRCTTPSALTAGASYAAGTSALLADATLTGNAVRSSDGRTIQLTDTRGYNQIGTLIVEPPMEPNAAGSADVRLSFDVLVGRGTIGEGISVSLAPLGSKAAHFDERGVAGGLVIAFRTTLDVMLVQFRGELLAERRLDGIRPRACDQYNCANCANATRCNMANCEWIDWAQICLQAVQRPRKHEFRTHAFVPIRITLVGEQLSVWHDGHEYLEQVHIPGWQTFARETRWQIIFGARITIRVDDHWVRDLRVEQGADVGAATTTISFADEGCDENSTLSFEYYAVPAISRLTQLQGPVRGGTPVRILGRHLTRGTPQPACRFGSEHVAASRGLDGSLECHTPVHGLVGTVPVEVALNSVDFTRVSSHFFTFTDPILVAVTPNVTLSGAAPTLLRLSGLRLDGGSSYRCQFDDAGNLSSVSAFFDAERESVFCTAPTTVAMGMRKTVAVELSLNGVDFTTSNQSITYHPNPTLTSLSPSVGPSSGATRVLLRGTFDTQLAWTCRFGGAHAEAIVVNTTAALINTTEATTIASDGSSALACITPSILESGALALQPFLLARLNFAPEEAPMHRAAGRNYYTLYGSAHVASGRLILTRDVPNHMGSCILAHAKDVQPHSATAFRVSFDVQVRGICRGGAADCGGNGLSVVFGNVPDNAFGINGIGAGDGLLVQLLTGPRLVAVSYRGAPMASVAVAYDLRAHTPQQLEVRYTVTGLFIRYESQIVVDGLAIHEWAPKASWRLAIGAQTGDGAQHSEHSIDNLIVELGDLGTRDGVIPVRVSVNGEQFSDAELMYTYLQPIWAALISPASGPLQGGTAVTIRGGSMAHGVDLRCSFNGSIVVASMVAKDSMACVTPPAGSDGSVQAAVTINGVDFSLQGLSFRYHAASVISTFFPLSGPIKGGSLISIHGVGFAHGTQPRCKYGIFGTTAASILSDQSMHCRSPVSLAMQGVPLEISLNAQQYTAQGHNFSTFVPPLISGLSPTHGPIAGDTSVRIAGVSFGGANSGAYACRFGEERVNASLVTASVLRCVTRALPLGSHCVEVSLNGQDFSDACTSFTAVALQDLLSASPMSGPAAGDTRVTLRGHNLAGGPDYRCRFILGPLSVLVNATFMRSALGDSVICYSPAWVSAPATQDLSVTTNGQQFTAPVPFKVFATPLISSLSPTSGPVLGVTAIQLLGTSLSGGSEYLCDFDGELVGARAISASELSCTAPAMNTTGRRDLRLSLNGQQFTPPHNFQYFADTNLSDRSLSPSSGPSAGGTRVRVAGSLSFSGGSHYQCSFGHSGRVAANLLNSSGTLECVSPTAVAAPGLQHFSVYLNGQQAVASNASFTYVGEPNILPPLPRSGPASGSTLITIHGTDLGMGSQYLCRCEGEVLGASYDADATAVRCVTPPSQRMCDAFARCRPRRGNSTCQVSLNGQQYSNVVQFLYHETARASASSPACGPLHGGTSVRISGVGFANGTDARCAFGAVRVAASASIDGGLEMLTCTLPSLSHVRALPLTVTLNGQQFSTEQLQFAVYAPPRLVEISPNPVPATGGSLLTIRGENVSSACDCRCSFGGIVVPCNTSPMQHVVMCRTPPSFDWIDAGSSNVTLRVSLNGLQYSNAVSLALHRPVQLISVCPLSGPVHGDTTLHLNGQYFQNTSQLGCRIGNLLVPALYLNASTISCSVPTSSEFAGAPLNTVMDHPSAFYRLVAPDVEPVDTECHTHLKALDYFGHADTTVEGHRCQNWLSQSPHLHDFAPHAFPGAGLGDHNFCRNPDGRATAWCFTLSKQTEWAFCDIGPPSKSCARQLEVFGNATRRGSALMLTATYGDAGHAEMPVAALVPADARAKPSVSGLWLEFDVLIGAPSATVMGESSDAGILVSDGMQTTFALHYGGKDEADDDLGSVYPHPGLSLRLITRGSVGQEARPRLDILVDGRTVHFVMPPGLSFIADSFRTVAVRLTIEHRLTVLFDGMTLVDELLVDGLAPDVDWRIRFAARNSALIQEVHAIDNVRAKVLSGHQSGAVDIAVTLNLHHYSERSLSFEFVSTARISSCTPMSGPAQGGTHVVLQGSGFQRGPDMRCRFDSITEVPASLYGGNRLICLSPAVASGLSVSLGVTLNGQNYGADSLRFTSYPSPSISHFSLEHGPTQGGTLVTVHGSGTLQLPSRT